MDIKPSRRDLIKQISVLATASGVALRNADGADLTRAQRRRPQTFARAQRPIPHDPKRDRCGGSWGQGARRAGCLWKKSSPLPNASA